MSLVNDVLLGLVTAFVIWIVKNIVQKIVDFWTMRNSDFNLTGCWYAEHGSYVDTNIAVTEIVYIWHSREKIKYRMEQYTNFEEAKRVFVGHGVLKSGVISSYYYSLDSTSKLIGCMNLQVKTKRASEIYLSGSFYEVDERKEKYSFENYPDDYYNLYRIPLDIKRKLKVKYWKNVFQSYKEVQKYVLQYK